MGIPDLILSPLPPSVSRAIRTQGTTNIRTGHQVYSDISSAIRGCASPIIRKVSISGARRLRIQADVCDKSKLICGVSQTKSRLLQFSPLEELRAGNMAGVHPDAHDPTRTRRSVSLTQTFTYHCPRYFFRSGCNNWLISGFARSAFVITTALRSIRFGGVFPFNLSVTARTAS
jgi:hypothetical protein